MRISDWSSDVCSSDLPRGVPRLRRVEADKLHLACGAHRSARRGAWGTVGTLVSLRSVRAVERRRAGRGRRGGRARIDLPPQLLVLGLIGRQHALAVGLHCLVLALERLHLGGQHLRSEEHTSELQSLMRISYAVFCLKKKKTQ